MKNLFKTLLILTLAVSCVFALASCEMLNELLANIPGFSTGDTNDGGEDEGEGNEEPTPGMRMYSISTVASDEPSRPSKKCFSSPALSEDSTK